MLRSHFHVVHVVVNNRRAGQAITREGHSSENNVVFYHFLNGYTGARFTTEVRNSAIKEQNQTPVEMNSTMFQHGEKMEKPKQCTDFNTGVLGKRILHLNRRI
jgi:hypothetical protein